MKRFISLFLVAGLFSTLFFGCSGDDGAAGPAGPSGTPQPIKVLVLGADTEANLKSVVAGAYAYGGFPLGTELGFIDIRTVVPEEATLLAYDVTVVYTDYNITDKPGFGDMLADYIDDGGRLVLLQYCFYTNVAPAGRIMTAGYSPFQPAAGASIAGNRYISYSSLSFPLHPIFNGTNVKDLEFWSNGNISSPVLDPTATLIALDDKGANAIAINADGNIIALQLAGAAVAWNIAEYPYAGILIANACLFLAGAF
ncbi:MAG: hypothetical protein MUF59_04030 [Candidatus Krumholzibacteria bacterium]|nr:hypothetical protein [Candidatus Krumholzibacteria bacterium]